MHGIAVTTAGPTTTGTEPTNTTTPCWKEGFDEKNNKWCCPGEAISNSTSLLCNFCDKIQILQHQKLSAFVIKCNFIDYMCMTCFHLFQRKNLFVVKWKRIIVLIQRTTARQLW